MPSSPFPCWPCRFPWLIQQTPEPPLPFKMREKKKGASIQIHAEGIYPSRRRSYLRVTGQFLPLSQRLHAAGLPGGPGAIPGRTAGQGNAAGKITCFSTPSLGRAKDVQEKFKQLAREGKSRVSKKDGHYMSVCVRLVREEKLLAPYRETFKRFGLKVDDTLLENPKWQGLPWTCREEKLPSIILREGW